MRNCVWKFRVLFILGCLSFLAAGLLLLNQHFFADAQSQSMITIEPQLTSAKYQVIYLPDATKKATIDISSPLVAKPFLQTV